jgi:hypothetical protein
MYMQYTYMYVPSYDYLWTSADFNFPIYQESTGIEKE